MEAGCSKELEALLILNNTPFIGSVKGRLLVGCFGSAFQALHASREEVEALPGFGPKVVQALEGWRTDRAWGEDLDLVVRKGITLLPYTSPHYPKRLLDIPDPPLLLYVQGKLTVTDHHGIAVVGTRNPSLYGKEMALKMGKDLASFGYAVVSGFARGIDTAAHEGALQGGGRTLAVMGCGLAHLYPPENRILAERVEERGALISEFPMNTPPDRQHFPQRNRIVSGMTMGTVLIEAPVKSGAMLTMYKGHSQGKTVFALPGRADNDAFRGNHLLIKQGMARLIESAADVVQGLDNLFAHQRLPNPVEVERPCLEPEEQALLAQMPPEELTVDEIAVISKLPIMKLNVLLMSLVLKKQLKEFPGKLYKKLLLN